MQIILTSIAAWFIAQGIKVLIFYRRTKIWNLKILTISGGVPSSHTAFVTAATTKIGLLEGVNSTLFGFAVILAFIIMYDAVGVRYAVGEQAKFLNRFQRDLKYVVPFRKKKIKEVCGHTLKEVALGFCIGVCCGLIF